MIKVINYAHQYPNYHLEIVYQQCANIIKDAVQAKRMGWIYRSLLLKSLQNYSFYIATENNQTDNKESLGMAPPPIIGFALCRELKRTGMISLDKLGVACAWRNRGVGTQLLDHIKSVNNTRGSWGMAPPPIRVEVVDHNLRCIAFYTKNGFVETKNKIIGNGINIIVMYYTP